MAKGSLQKYFSKRPKLLNAYVILQENELIIKNFDIPENISKYDIDQLRCFTNKIKHDFSNYDAIEKKLENKKFFTEAYKRLNTNFYRKVGAILNLKHHIIYELRNIRINEFRKKI